MQKSSGIPAIPGKLVDIGNYKLHIHDTGIGAPTVVLDACLGGNSVYWGLVQPEVAKFIQVCSYDRAGLGWSDESPLERTSENIVKELHELLHKAGKSAPYILVGHSSGGINMRLYANMYPEEVYGVILVDSSHEDQLDIFEKIDAQFKPSGLQRFKTWCLNNRVSQTCMRALRACHVLAPEVNTFFPSPLRAHIQALEKLPKALRAGNGEWTSFKTSMQQLKNSQNQLFNKPLIVITGCKKREDIFPRDRLRMREYDKVWVKFQKDFLTKSHKGTQLFAEKSGHFILFDEPDVVIGAIRTMVAQYRNS